MCGIAGELRFGDRADVCAVERMAESLAPRGPDGSGIWAQGPVAFGHRRLTIIDLSSTGAQPMHDPELGLTIVFNGCIYNYKALRAQLERQGYSFFSRSDTEVLLKAYHAWGDDFVDRLIGMWAFAIHERDSGDVLLGRDRLGVKPLYLAEANGRLRFASSLPALVAAGDLDTSIDPVALHHYLSFHSVVPAPLTILRGVRKLPAATLMRVAPDGERRQWTFWAPSYERDSGRDDLEPEDWSAAVLNTLQRAVDRRMIADVPVGVLLSGGLDSSLIVALLAARGQKGLKTFSVGFERAGDVEGNEFEFSDLVSREFGTDHDREVVSNGRVLPSLERAIAAMSEPMTSHDVVAFHLLSEEVSKHVTVVQSGQGADEVFAGYDWYPPLEEADGDGAAVYRREFVDRPHSEIAACVSPDYQVDEDVSQAFVESHFRAPGADDPLDRALRLDTSVMLVEDPVKRVDNMTMAWGLEGRVPFLDHEVVELAAAIPPSLKVADEGKGVLKKAARGVVPDAVIDRQKGYFPVPPLMHLDGPFMELVQSALSDPAARGRALFQQSYVDRLMAAPNDERTPLGSNKLWQLASLELWLQAQGL